MKIAKEFHWEMGHRLPFHKGKCINLHGHSYKAVVEVEGTPDKNGLVIDFYDLKNIVNPIIEKMDHAFMVYEKDKALIKTLKTIKTKKIMVPFQSTVENICRYLLEETGDALDSFSNIYSVTVTVYETPDSYARDTYFGRLPN